MRRLLIIIVAVLAVVCALPQRVEAQYDRNYIYWVGQQRMVQNNYP